MGVERLNKEDEMIFKCSEPIGIRQTQPPSTMKFRAEHIRAISDATKSATAVISSGCTRPARRWLLSLKSLAASFTQRSNCRFVITHPGTFRVSG